MDNATKPDLRSRLASVVQHIPGGALLFAIISLVMLGYFGWYYYGADHLDHALYSLRLENLTVTPPPAWVKSKVVEDVYHNGRLDRLSLLEPRATAAIAQAFETHHWVRSTTRVTKAVGGNVMVDLVYRRPAAMVYAETLDNESDPPVLVKGFYPIDSEATVLPMQDFTTEDVWNYFQIFAQDARPAGAVGMPYGDLRVTEALLLCGFLEKYREPYRLQEIKVDHDGLANGPSPWTLSIRTHDKSRQILWGHAPKFESPGEMPAEVKLNRMLAWLKQSPPGSSSEPKKLDLRFPTPGSPVSLPR